VIHDAHAARTEPRGDPVPAADQFVQVFVRD
jgi:hypothetical protein